MTILHRVWGVLGLILLCGCVAAPVAPDAAARRTAEIERAMAARSYADFLQGRYAALTNDPQRAAMAYQAVSGDNPGSAELLERAVFSALIAGQAPAAIRTARSAPAATLNETALPRLALGLDDLSRAPGWKRAAASLAFASGSPFNDMIARHARAWAAYNSGGLSASARILADQDEGDVLVSGLSGATLALIQLHAGSDDAALETFERIWASGLRLAVATEYHARLLHAAGRTGDAIDRLAMFGDEIGQNAAIEALLADLRAGRPVGTVRPSLAEGAALSVYIPAAALAARTETDLAGVYFALALHLDPGLHVARTLWGDALDRAGRREDAIAILESVPESSVFHATARGQIAWALRRMDRNEEALAVASEALEAAPDRNLKIQLGDLFRSLGKHDEAERIFGEIIEADAAAGREDWRLLYARGAARQELGRWPEAEQDLLGALEQAPDEPALLNYLGYSWIDRGENLEDGFYLIERAVQLRPDAGYIVDSLGWAYYRLGRYEEAVEQLERAVELSPGEPVLNDHLGDAYWRVGRTLEAGFQWNRALTLAPEAEDAALLHAKLETGLDNALARLASNGALPDRPHTP